MSLTRNLITDKVVRDLTRRRFISGSASIGALTLLNSGAASQNLAMDKSREGSMQQASQAVVGNGNSNIAPIPMECDAPFLKIVGELPRELNGTLYRNGPNPQFDAPGAHWFVGDGMLHAFHLENGRASYRNRWVRTPKWLAEHDAGRALFGGFGRKLPDAPAIRDQRRRRRQHQHHLPCRPPAGAGRRPPADRDRARHAEDTRLCRLRPRHRRPVHRASQGRSRHRRNDVLRLQCQGPVHAGAVVRFGQRGGRGHALRALRDALLPAWCTTSSSPKTICCSRSCR